MGLVDHLPEHLKSRRTAEAVTAPSAILLAGAGAAVGIVAGLPLVAAAGVGALAWTARVALGLPRRPRPDRIDPMTIGEPWRRVVMGALDAQRRYTKAVRAATPGPLRDRLVEIGERIAAGTQECWRIARRGDALEDAMATLDTDAARRELATLDSATYSGSASVQSTRAALEAQIASADRMAAVAADARDRLRLLEARLDEAVARAVELSLRADDVTDVGGLGGDVDALVSEMESLRQGLEEAGGASRAAQT
jgi:hypothetical protein